MQELLVSAYQWTSEDIPIRRTLDDRTTVLCWAMDTKSQPCLLRIEDFQPFCYLELPRKVGNDSNFKWTNESVNRLMDQAAGKLRDSTPIGCKLMFGKKLYYYATKADVPFVCVTFKNTAYMKSFARSWSYGINTYDFGHLKLKCHETKIALDRKLLTRCGIGYTQWFTSQGMPVTDPEKRYCQKPNFPEYIVSYTTIKPGDPAKTAKMVTHPKILAYDGEMYSNQHRAMPRALDPAHDCYMISCVIQNQGEPETRKHVGIIYGNCNEIPSDKLKDVRIIRTESEYQMYCEFAKLVQEEDPTVLSGYNIFGFDNPYIDDRLNTDIRKWPDFSRTNKPTTLDGRSWESSGFGFNTLKYIGAEGRISIDMMVVMKRDHKLKNYRLETVSQYFLKRGKHDVSPIEMFTIYERMREALKNYKEKGEEKAPPKVIKELEDAKAEMTRVMFYCIVDSDLIIDLMEKLNTWVTMVSLANVFGINVMDIYVRGQQTRCLSSIYNKVAKPGRSPLLVIDSIEVKSKSFKGGAVQKPRVGCSENVITLDFSSLYPSIIRKYNICYTTFVTDDMKDIPDEWCNIIEFEEDIADFEDKDDSDGDDPEDDCKDRKESKSNGKIKRRYRFIKAEILPGILPELETEFVNERNAVKKLQKQYAKGTIDYVLLDGKQLGIKMSANSIFGFLGVGEKGLLPFMEAATSITAWGRQSIAKVQEYVREKYKTKRDPIVYGDTDSVMVDLEIKTWQEADRMGKVLAEEINGRDADPEKGIPAIKGLFEAPLKMEFEKAFAVMMCLTPKRYAGILIDGKTGPMLKEEDLFLRGLDLAKRDKCEYHYEIYRTILLCILHKKSFNEALDLLTDKIENMMLGKVPHAKFAITTTLGKYSAGSTYFMKRFSDNLVGWGVAASPGDRLEYIFSRSVDEPLLPKSKDPKISSGDRMRVPQQFDEQLKLPMAPPGVSWRTDEKKYRSFDVAYLYYLEKRFANPVNQLFNVGYGETIAKLTKQGFSFRKTSRHRPITPEKLLNIICGVYQVGANLRDIIKRIKDLLEPKCNIVLVIGK